MFEGSTPTEVLDAIASHDFGADDLGRDHVDAIAALDRVRAMVDALQLGHVNALFEAQKGPHLTTDENALSVVGQVSMARNIGATAAGNQVTAAFALEGLPRVGSLLRDGSIPETVFRAVQREASCLDPADLELADAEVARRVVGLTPRKAAGLTRDVVIGLDAEAAHERAERDRADSFLAMYPEPNGVASLYVRGPAEQITAAFDALELHASAQRAAGDPRSRGQILCQTLVERITGLTHADRIDVELQLVMDAATLVGDSSDAAVLVGYGPIAPDVADEILARALKPSVRRLLTDPVDGSLVARDPRRRFFDGPLGGFLRARDRTCRRPGCDCRARESDHVVDHARGGRTTAEDGQRLCIRSHHLKDLPGWSTRRDDRAVVWTTPTGHEYRSNPPPQLPRAG